MRRKLKGSALPSPEVNRVSIPRLRLPAGVTGDSRFRTGFDWWKTEPQDELVNHGAFCLAEPGRLYTVYLPQCGNVTIKLIQGCYQANWFNPRTGKATPLLPAEGSTWTSPEAPDRGDWALLLKRM